MTNETKQTAVEQLFVEMLQIQQAGILLTLDEYFELLEKYKEMEKEQTMNFALDYMMQSKPIVDYYNETYGGNK